MDEQVQRSHIKDLCRPCRSHTTSSLPCVCGNNRCTDPIVRALRPPSNAMRLWDNAYMSRSVGTRPRKLQPSAAESHKWYDNTYNNRHHSKAFVTPLFRRNLPYLQPPGPLPAYNETIPHETSYQREFTPSIAFRAKSEKNTSTRFVDSPLHRTFSKAQMRTKVCPFTAVPVDYSSEYSSRCASARDLNVSTFSVDDTPEKPKIANKTKTPFEELFDCSYFKSAGVSGPKGADAGFWPAKLRTKS